MIVMETRHAVGIAEYERMPAHTTHPTTLATQESANQLKLGSQETANRRTIFQYIHEGGVYLTYEVTGNVTFKLARVKGPTAVLSGVFFD